MKIYIPSLGRPNNQKAYDNLPSFLQEKTVLVVQPHENHLYSNYPIVVLPEDDYGISNTRKYIMELGHGEIFAMMDDDVIVKERTPNMSPTKRPMTEDSWKHLIDTTMEWLESDVNFVSLMQGNLPPRGKDYADNSASCALVFYDGKKIPTTNEFNWFPDLLAEDAHIHLQLLLKGYNNRVWQKYCCTQLSYSKGGCESFRSLDMMNKSHEKLVEQYPDVVKWFTKDGKQLISENKKSYGWKRVKILYNKAGKIGANNVCP